MEKYYGESADIARLYGENAEVQRIAAEGQWEGDRQFVDAFLAYLPKNGHILDIGAGSGNQAKYFVDNGYHVSLTDGSEEMLATAQQAVPEVEGRVGVLPEVPYQDNIFDSVFVRHVLQHLAPEDIEASLDNIYKTLKDEGHLGLIIAISGYDEAQTAWWGITANESVRINHYPYDFLKDVLEHCKFDIVSEEKVYEGENPILRVIAKKRIEK